MHIINDRRLRFTSERFNVNEYDNQWQVNKYHRHFSTKLIHVYAYNNVCDTGLISKYKIFVMKYII